MTQSPAGWLPRTGISSGTLRSVIEYGLPLHFVTLFAHDLLVTDLISSASSSSLGQYALPESKNEPLCGLQYRVWSAKEWSIFHRLPNCWICALFRLCSSVHFSFHEFNLRCLTTEYFLMLLIHLIVMTNMVCSRFLYFVYQYLAYFSYYQTLCDNQDFSFVPHVESSWRKNYVHIITINIELNCIYTSSWLIFYGSVQ